MSEETMEITTQNTELASNTVTSFKDNLFTEMREQGYWASFAVETMEDKKNLYRARNDNELLKDHMDEPIAIAGIVLDTVQINDEQVGAKTVPCVHIIDITGRVFQSSSSGVVTSACDIISSFGMPDTWDEPLQVACHETNTAKGYRYKYLALV